LKSPVVLTHTKIIMAVQSPLPGKELEALLRVFSI